MELKLLFMEELLISHQWGPLAMPYVIDWGLGELNLVTDPFFLGSRHILEVITDPSMSGVVVTVIPPHFLIHAYEPDEVLLRLRFCHVHLRLVPLHCRGPSLSLKHRRSEPYAELERALRKLRELQSLPRTYWKPEE